MLNAVAAIGSALFALQQFAGINGVLYFSSLTFRDAGITNGIAASAAVGVANLIGMNLLASFYFILFYFLIFQSYMNIATEINLTCSTYRVPIKKK